MIPPVRGRSRTPSVTRGTKGKIIDRGAIPDPGHQGKEIEWVIWDNSNQPEGKKHVPNLCGLFLKTGKCEWFDKGQCERPHMDKDERDRRKKVLDAHMW